jgi:hypothetical protein
MTEVEENDMVGHASRVIEIINAYKLLVGKLETMRPLWMTGYY